MAIIQKAGTIKPSTLVMGLPADGKTSTIMQEIEERQFNPLWIVFGNITVVSEKHPEWDAIMVNNWYEMNEAYNEFRSNPESIKQYDVVVIEGLGVMSTMALMDAIAKSNNNNQQAAYLAMGRELSGILTGLRDLFGAIFVTLNLQKTEDNNLEMVINPHLYNSVIPFFGQTWYAYSEPKADKTGVNYIRQTNPTFALRFKPTVRKVE
jgi:hypothetical protein